MPHSLFRAGAAGVVAAVAMAMGACCPADSPAPVAVADSSQSVSSSSSPTSPPTSPPPASTPPTETSVRVVDIAAGQQADPVDVDVNGGAEGVGVTYREITLAPGASTGEHCHYGQLIAVVEKGELTHYAPVYPGGVRVYRQGESIIEGSGYIHQGVNEGDDDVVLVVTYVIPKGKSLAETDLAHCDH